MVCTTLSHIYLFCLLTERHLEL